MAGHRPTCSSRAIRTSTGGRRTSSRRALVRDTQVSIDGEILVTHALDGSVAVRQTGGNLGREGLGWAVACGVIGKLIDHRVEQDVHDHSDS
jgi:hypothetical protein